MAVTCGNCLNKHEDADAVRACYAGVQTLLEADGKHESDRPGLGRYEMAPASPQQLKFIEGLKDERNTELLTAQQATLLGKFKSKKPLSVKDATVLITAMKGLPWQRPADPLPEVPAGKYAITEDGEVTFWQISKPTEGKWSGRVFVNMIVGAPGSWRRVDVGRDRRKAATDAIKADARGAAALFGFKTRSCGRCSSPLSDPRSRAAGYGEKCASDLGWYYPTKQEALRILGEMEEKANAST